MPIIKEVFETIETAIADQNTAFIAQITEDLHPADICAILQEMDEMQQDFILKSLDIWRSKIKFKLILICINIAFYNGVGTNYNTRIKNFDNFRYYKNFKIFLIFEER